MAILQTPTSVFACDRMIDTQSMPASSSLAVQDAIERVSDVA
jgi:hypothetical protein